jgi:hypothetical protein
LKEPWLPGTFSSGVKHPERAVDDRPVSKAEFKKDWGSTSTLAHAFKLCTGTGLRNICISEIFASLNQRQYINSPELFPMCAVEISS